MKKTLRLVLMSMFVLFAGQAMAEEVTFDFNNDIATIFPTITSYSSGTGASYVADGEFNETTTSAAIGGVTVTVSASDAEANNRNRLWATNPRLRMYDGTLTFASSGEKITKIVMTLTTNKSLVANGNTADSGTLSEVTKQSNAEVTWTGEAQSVVISIAGNTQYSKAVVTLGGEPVGPGEEDKVLYNETFTSGIGKFTIDDVKLPEGLSFVWSSDSKYGAKASAYYNSTNYETESWLVSPVIDLSQATETKLVFSQALNKFATIDDAKTQTSVLMSVNGGNWTPVEGITYPEELSWTFVESSIDIASLADGKKIQVAFQYTSSTESCGTWEISPFVIKGKGEATLEQGVVPEAKTKVASIEALLALESPSTDLELTLTNAKVLFNDGNYIYVRENGKAVCFYKVDAIKNLFKDNAIVSGTIRVDYEIYKLLPEVKANNYTNADALTVVESEVEAAPVQTTLTAVDEGSHVCDLVTLTATLVRKQTYKTDESGQIVKNDETQEPVVSNTTYYLQDEEAEIVVVNNNKNLKDLADAGVVESTETGKVSTKSNITITGIVNTSNNVYQIKLTKDAVDANGEQEFDGDVNADGTVDVADISAVISQMAGTSTYPKADVNGDGTVDVADISSVITIMAGN